MSEEMRIDLPNEVNTVEKVQMFLKYVKGLKVSTWVYNFEVHVKY